MRTTLFILALSICNCGISQKSDDNMVLIPEGWFIMGKNTETASDWQPEHSVRVDFAVGFRCVKDIQ